MNTKSRYSILSFSEKEQWTDCLNKLPIAQRDIYFTPEYYKLYENYGDGVAKCFVFEDGINTALYPFLINSVNVLGYNLNDQYFDIQGAYGYNGVVSSSYGQDFIASFHSAFNDYTAENNIIAEFTRFHPIIENNFFSNSLSVFEDRSTVILDLRNDYELIWNSSYSSINRNMIRKAKNNNITVSISNTESDYKSFFEIYKNTMHNIGANEYYYFSGLFFNDFKTLLSNNHKLLLAKINGELICAALLMFYGNYAHYHLSGRLKEYSNTGVNNLILDEAVKIAQKENCSWFHFGGGNTNLSNDPLLKFKSNFSKDKLTFFIGKKIHNKKIYDIVIDQWTERFPEKGTKYKNFVLKYRY
jgi:hypothetical protein